MVARCEIFEIAGGMLSRVGRAARAESRLGCGQSPVIRTRQDGSTRAKHSEPPRPGRPGRQQAACCMCACRYLRRRHVWCLAPPRFCETQAPYSHSIVTGFGKSLFGLNVRVIQPRFYRQIYRHFHEHPLARGVHYLSRCIEDNRRFHNDSLSRRIAVYWLATRFRRVSTRP